jgi:adenine phosphoribosyltransferase
MLRGVSELREALKARFQWLGDRTDIGYRADPTAWWRSPQIMRDLGPGLAELFAEAQPSVVLAPASRGLLVGSLVAAHLGIGLVEVRKEPGQAADSDAWLVRTSPPDYRDRHLTLGFRKRLIKDGDRVLFVDDWIATGGQALTAQALVRDAGAEWAGAAVIVDGLEFSSYRRSLSLRSLLHIRELG